MLKALRQFFLEDLWRIRLKQVPAWKRVPIKFLRIVLTAIRRFHDNRSQLKASALTYYTLLAIVPVFAALFGIAQGFGIETIVRKDLSERFVDHQEVFQWVMGFAEKLLDETRGGIVAGIGVVVLLWSVIKVLGHIETAFNAIWNIKSRRPWLRRISDYVSMVVIFPLLLALASGVTVYITRGVGPLAEGALGRILPLLFTWLLFTTLYLFIPNTRVPFRAALAGGIMAGTAYHLVQWGYIAFQVGMTGYNAIYGSFAALPLFLIWVQISWLIVLSGAEICYASQHVAAWEFKHDISRISYRFRRLLALVVLRHCFERFRDGEGPVTAVAISDELELPISLTQRLLSALLSAGLLVETTGPAYVPGRPVGSLTVGNAIDAMEEQGTEKIPVKHSIAFRTMNRCLQQATPSAWKEDQLLLSDP